MTTKTRSERETIICRAQDEDSWHVFSEVPAIVRKLTKLHGPGTPKGQGFVWTVPPRCISFRNPRQRANSGNQGANLRVRRTPTDTPAPNSTPA